MCAEQLSAPSAWEGKPQRCASSSTHPRPPLPQRVLGGRYFAIGFWNQSSAAAVVPLSQLCFHGTPQGGWVAASSTPGVRVNWKGNDTQVIGWLAVLYSHNSGLSPLERSAICFAGYICGLWQTLLQTRFCETGHNEFWGWAFFFSFLKIALLVFSDCGLPSSALCMMTYFLNHHRCDRFIVLFYLFIVRVSGEIGLQPRS